MGEPISVNIRLTLNSTDDPSCAHLDEVQLVNHLQTLEKVGKFAKADFTRQALLHFWRHLKAPHGTEAVLPVTHLASNAEASTNKQPISQPTPPDIKRHGMTVDM